MVTFSLMLANMKLQLCSMSNTSSVMHSSMCCIILCIAVLREQYRIQALVSKVSTTWPPCTIDWVSPMQPDCSQTVVIGCLMVTGRWAESEMLYKESLEQSGEHATTYNNLGKILGQT